MRVVVHGIANCDTVSRARAWLDAQGITHEFRDFRKIALTPAQLSAWLGEVPLDTLLNRRGTTWRGLPDDTRTAVADTANPSAAIALMIDKPAVIKRPVLEVDGRVARVGFSAAQYQEILRPSAAPAPTAQRRDPT